MAQSSSAHWRPQGGSPSAGGGKAARRRKLIALAAGVLALTGAIAAWLCYPSPFEPPHFVPLCVGEYGTQYPVRPWVRQDADTLRGLPWRERDAFTKQERSLLLAALRSLADHPAHEPLVIYLSAYVLPSAGGELSLLAADSRLDRPDSWLSLREVFRHIADSPARHKLVLLDVMSPFTDARLGLLANDQAQHLQPLLEEATSGDPSLQILCACSPGQVSLVSESLGHSVFGYQLARGLLGEADGWNGGSRNRRVSVQEIVGFVRERVDRWALHNREVRQTPRFVGSGPDFDLVQVEVGRASLEEPPEIAYPAWLKAGWTLRDAWWADGTFRHAPQVFARLEALLLRADQEWRGGIDEARIRAGLEVRLEQLKRQRDEQVPAPDPSGPRSLAQAVARRRKPLETGGRETLIEVRRLVALAERTVGQKPDAPDVQKLALETGELLKKFEGRPLEFAWVLFEVAAETRLNRDGLAFLSGLLEKGDAPPFEEIRYLRQLLTRVRVAEGQPWPADNVQYALQMVREAEKTAAADPWALPWVREDMLLAARQRESAERLLWGMGPAGPDRPSGEALREARNTYQSINEALEVIAAAQRSRDEALALLPTFLPYLEADEGPGGDWETALGTALRLRELLGTSQPDAATRGGGLLAKLTDLTAEQRNDLNKLQRTRGAPERGPWRRAIGPSAWGEPSDERIMRGFLETPWPTAQQRADLYKGWQTECARLLSGQRDSGKRTGWDPDPALAAEFARALRRARHAIGLLQLKGVEPSPRLQEALMRACAAPADRGRRNLLAEELAQVWARQ